MMLFWRCSYMKTMVINLSFFIGVRIDAEKLLKRFAFSQKSETNLPLTNKGGIAGIIFLQSSLLKIAQHVFAAVFGS